VVIVYVTLTVLNSVTISKSVILAPFYINFDAMTLEFQAAINPGC